MKFGLTFASSVGTDAVSIRHETDPSRSGASRMIYPAFSRTLIVTLFLLMACPLPLWAKGDPGVKCGASLFKAVGKACSVELSCHSKYAKAPGKDPAQEKLQACLAKNEAKLQSSLAKAEAGAAKKGAVCSVPEREARLQAGALGTATRLGMLTDWDPHSGDAVDDGMRAGLLKAGGKACGQVLSVISKQVSKPSQTAFDKGMLKALVGFAKSAGKAVQKAEKKGGSGIDTQLLQAIVDNMREAGERFNPEPPDNPSTEAFEVSSGDKHSCLMRTDGSVDCWGDNTWGQSRAPNKEFFSVAAGHRHSCGIRESDDKAECWGDDTDGQVSDVPSDELGFEITAGGGHGCALRFDNTPVCWGDDTYGQATPSFPNREYFDISAGEFHTCAYRIDNGKVDCWGRDQFGQTTNPLPDVSYRDISAGGWLTCGVQSDSTLRCWGSTPSPPTGIFFDVSAGRDFGCALRSGASSTAECWGVLGPWRAPPDNVSFAQISAGGRHTCAVRDDNFKVTCWGEDDEGQTSCTGVEDCIGAAPPPCSIANEGPLFGKAGRMVIREVLGDPDNDYRLIIPKEYLELFRDLGPRDGTVQQIVDAFDARGFSCTGDDRIAIDFPAEELEVVNLLHELGVLDPLVGFIIDEVYEPIKEWFIDQLLAEIRKFIAQCLIELVIFQSSCV